MKFSLSSFLFTALLVPSTEVKSLCSWSSHDNTYLPGSWANGESTLYPVADAKALCATLGPSVCFGVTCADPDDRCTPRDSNVMAYQGGATAFLPSEDCYPSSSDETVQFIDGGVGTCRTAEGEETQRLFVDCRSATPYSMKSNDHHAGFPPFVTGTDPTSFCQQLCAERSECVGFTYSDWYAGGCQLHGFSSGLLDQSTELNTLIWGQENMCGRRFEWQTNSEYCTDNCVITQTDGIQSRNYHCYYKANQGPPPPAAPTFPPTTLNAGDYEI